MQIGFYREFQSISPKYWCKSGEFEAQVMGKTDHSTCTTESDASWSKNHDSLWIRPWVLVKTNLQIRSSESTGWAVGIYGLLKSWIGHDWPGKLKIHIDTRGLLPHWLLSFQHFRLFRSLFDIVGWADRFETIATILTSFSAPNTWKPVQRFPPAMASESGHWNNMASSKTSQISQCLTWNTLMLVRAPPAAPVQRVGVRALGHCLIDS